MEAKFLVNPALKTGSLEGVEAVSTDLLMLAKLSGMGLGPGPQAVDQRLAGRLSEKMRQRKFQGNLGEHLTLKIGPDAPARNVLLVGLGSPGKLDYRGWKEVIQLAVDRAVTMGCSRLTLEIPKDRLTAASMNLTGTAHAIKEFVTTKLAELTANRQGILEVELVCTPQAARYLKKGLSIQQRAKRSQSCTTPPSAK
ncbi:MAG TPA: M17 family peptidase N-terminal domain-containing protein [Planktothrix sp.]